MEIESGENASLATAIAFVLASGVTIVGIARMLLRRFGSPDR
jgi:hypothetical protein